MFGPRRCGCELLGPRSSVEFAFPGSEQLSHGPSRAVIERNGGIQPVAGELFALLVGEGHTVSFRLGSVAGSEGHK